ncbi:GNAT family N-acetyltransferase [Solwaraspora sp. WMMD1047]|uniref:GNAT family N-acetyltransferase n=1 Tax=Solwaraspora sp. WMMD1047 TaxID=3016102 RepID=UPI0024172095|nr:GNAT family N-acetyltransferase [Solwaraspora sp. WMMD1047]MDG4833230.1 GNAT family N-acetyltransferase [Solwaraspora sp. WMMD1047]
MLRQQDVGHRIVVRRIVGVRYGRTLFSDALGELVELTETHLTIATARGVVQVPLTEVHRAKRVPPARRPMASAVVELERAANESWPAPVQERMGGWLLRTAGGWTGRANSALPIGDPDRPLEAAIDAVVAWYAEHGQPAMINVPLPLAAPVGVALDERGWGARPLTLVQTAPLTTLLTTAPAGAALQVGVPELAAEPSPGWLALAGAGKAARSSGREDRTLPATARHVLTAVGTVRFAHLYAERGPRSGGGELLAIARGTVTGAGRWLGISLIEVEPAARRRGLAGLLIRALAEWAAERGATDAFLQVEERNTGAVALYRKLGFRTHHTYLTRVAPGHR